MGQRGGGDDAHHLGGVGAQPLVGLEIGAPRGRHERSDRDWPGNALSAVRRGGSEGPSRRMRVCRKGRHLASHRKAQMKGLALHAGGSSAGEDRSCRDPPSAGVSSGDGGCPSCCWCALNLEGIEHERIGWVHPVGRWMRNGRFSTARWRGLYQRHRLALLSRLPINKLAKLKQIDKQKARACAQTLNHRTSYQVGFSLLSTLASTLASTAVAT